MENNPILAKYNTARVALSNAEASGDVAAITRAKRAFVKAARTVRDELGPQMLSRSVLAMIAN